MNQKVVFDFDEFFKDYFNTDDIKERIYNQMAKTIAKGIDIDLAKTPLVDLITGYTRYKQMEFEVKNLENRLKEKDKVVNDLLKRISNLEFEVERLEKEKKQVLDKLNTPLAFTSSYQLNYQSAMLLIEEVKSILQGSDSNGNL